MARFLAVRTPPPAPTTASPASSLAAASLHDHHSVRRGAAPPTPLNITLAALAVAQLVALVVVVRRLLPGRYRLPPVQPREEVATDRPAGRVSVVVPARNEAARIGHCLDGLRAQGQTMLEAIVVDGASTDATREIVRAAASGDARIRLIDEPPRPAFAVGRPWAIAAGARLASGEWVLVVDADVMPRPGMVAGALAAAEEHGYDIVSFAPTIFAPGLGARWLQASFVISLVYRFGATGAEVGQPERAVANGQCQLMRRAVLERAGGYEIAAASYCDDVQVVRALGAAGARAGFLDGRELFDVLMYPTARSTWRAWPRSLNMRDATTPRWRVMDALVLLLAQALPLPVLLAVLAWELLGSPHLHAAPVALIIGVNVLLLTIRLLVLAAIARSFVPRGFSFWLSPLADPASALRVAGTMFTRSREWRGTAVPATGNR